MLQLSHMAEQHRNLTSEPPSSPRREFPPANGPGHRRLPSPGIRTNGTIASSPAPARLHNASKNLPRTIFKQPVSFGAFLVTQRSNGSASGARLRRGGSGVVPRPTPSETASSSGDGDQEDDSEASSEVEHIQTQERPAPRAFLPPPPLGDPRVRLPGSWHPPGGPPPLAPPRFIPENRSSSSSSGSGSSSTKTTRTSAERRKLLSNVADQRLKLHRLRESMRKKRIDLQARRRQTDVADNEFMQILRPLLVSTTSLATLSTELVNEHILKLQQARDEYYVAETVYGALEADVDREESLLHALEVELHSFIDAEGQDERYDLSHGPSNAEEEAPPESSHESETGEMGKGVRRHNNDNTKRAPWYYLLGIDGDRAEDVHPLYQELLGAAGDRELAREHHIELHRRHDRILNDLEMDLHRERARTGLGNQLSDGDLLSLKTSLTELPPSTDEFERKFGIPIDEDDLEFLQGYDDEEETVQKKMEETECEVLRMRALCEEKGAMRKNRPYEEEYTILRGTNMAAMLPKGNMALSDRPARNLSHPIFPTLLSNPMHVMDLRSPSEALQLAMQMPKDYPTAALWKINCTKELAISRLLINPADKADFVNKWLIHRLRTSPMEVELLFSISSGTLRIMNLRRWQEDVLSHWKTDAAANLRPGLEGPRTPRDELEVDDGSRVHVNSILETLLRARSDDENAHYENRERRPRGENLRSVRSLPSGCGGL